GYTRGTVSHALGRIGADGSVLNRHRKLVPTNPERMVWATGDAAGLRVTETAVGRIGGLICWESYMPLARFAVFAQGCEIYVAPTWDSGERGLATMRHSRAEGRGWVSGTCLAMG